MVSNIVDDVTRRIGGRILVEREARGWSLSDLAEHSGVSRAMIHKVERGESSPTATLLGKLSGAFGLSISALIARAEPSPTTVVVRAEQETWTDIETGYVRRQIVSSPAGDMTEVEMPPGRQVDYPAAAYEFGIHVVWVLEGRLTFVAGTQSHTLDVGDCLRLGEPVPAAYRNDTAVPVRYLVTVLGSGTGRHRGTS